MLNKYKQDTCYISKTNLPIEDSGSIGDLHAVTLVGNG